MVQGVFQICLQYLHACWFDRNRTPIGQSKLDLMDRDYLDSSSCHTMLNLGVPKTWWWFKINFQAWRISLGNCTTWHGYHQLRLWSLLGGHCVLSVRQWRPHPWNPRGKQRLAGGKKHFHWGLEMCVDLPFSRLKMDPLILKLSCSLMFCRRITVEARCCCGRREVAGSSKASLGHWPLAIDASKFLQEITIRISLRRWSRSERWLQLESGQQWGPMPWIGISVAFLSMQFTFTDFARYELGSTSWVPVVNA